MRILSTKIHGYLDYSVGILLIVAPWLFGFAQGGMETWIFIILGAGAIIYSLITNYELGAAKILSMPAHLGMDILSGILLASSPWLFGFHDYVYMPHLVLGIAEIAVASITDRQPYRSAKGSVRM